jgi:flavorubredoxin
VDGFAFRLILMALKTLGRIDILVERHGMLFRKCRNYLNRYKENCELEEAGEGLTNFELNAHTETK